MCGEKSAGAYQGAAALGSPPRVRGKGKHCEMFRGVSGITPACAGKSAHLPLYYLQPQDHPRVCGEKFGKTEKSRKTLGSPPRVRGKVRVYIIIFLAQRITPACAGKRNPKKEREKAPWDHPRVCGEKFYLSGGACPSLGSPPRVRGKVVIEINKLSADGITPACAGKSPL